MAFGYPISLEVAGRRAVVIGRTAVAQGKADALLEAGAPVTVISPGPGPALSRLERHERATVLRRDYQAGDLEGAFLCVASSEDAKVRAAVHAEARWRRVLVNVMDDIPHCDFAAPALVRRGNLAIAKRSLDSSTPGGKSWWTCWARSGWRPFPTFATTGSGRGDGRRLSTSTSCWT